MEGKPEVRKIIHVDLDAFYAAVEQRDRPELRGKPVIVGGQPNGRGVVATASYEARKFGVRSAMPASQAHRLCPHGIFVSPQFKKYLAVSQEIRKIFRSVTDLVEPLSLDEAYLDVTQNHWNEPSAGRIARRLKDEIKKSTGLTASAGVSPLKFVSKIASDLQKPDGLVVIPPHKVEEFILRLKVEQLWGVGPVTTQRLKSKGFHGVPDLRKHSRNELVEMLGKFGGFLSDMAWGKDSRKVSSNRGLPKSKSSERTFSKDLENEEDMESILHEMSEELAQAMEKKNLSFRCLTLKVRYPDFKTITRSFTFPLAHRSCQEIFKRCCQLLTETQATSLGVRLLGLGVSGLVEGIPRQAPCHLHDDDQMHFHFDTSEC